MDGTKPIRNLNLEVGKPEWVSQAAWSNPAAWLRKSEPIASWADVFIHLSEPQFPICKMGVLPSWKVLVNIKCNDACEIPNMLGPSKSLSPRFSLCASWRR